MIHTVKGFGIVNKAETDVFLELSCFSDDPSDVGNLISGSSAFSRAFQLRAIQPRTIIDPGDFHQWIPDLSKPLLMET